MFTCMWMPGATLKNTQHGHGNERAGERGREVANIEGAVNEVAQQRRGHHAALRRFEPPALQRRVLARFEARCTAPRARQPP